MSEQDRVRRLLGDLRATDDAAPPAMPADLAARLDARLGEETAGAPTQQPAEPGQRATVVPLRRRLAPLLVAAAVVLVAGGVVVGLDQGGGDEAASSDAAGGSAAEPEAATEQAPEQAPQDPEQLLPDPPRGGLDDTTTRMTAAPYLTVRDFDTDARALVRAGEVATGDDPRQDATARERVEGSGCAVPDDDLGAATLVSLDGDPAVLVVGPVDDEQQVVAVSDCLGRAVASTTVPAS